MTRLYTFKGIFDPDLPIFDVEDIAHALAQICRYGGHCKHFYSVAEHSLLVAGLMAELKLGDPFEGLLHDAVEAYTGDVPNPFKTRWTTHVEDERRIDRALREHFKLPLEKSEGCNKADKLALFIEVNFLMWDKGADFYDSLSVREQAQELIKQHWRVHGFEPGLGAHLWMKGYQHYGPKIEAISASGTPLGNVVEGSSLVIP